jgi:hypothetical protein
VNEKIKTVVFPIACYAHTYYRSMYRWLSPPVDGVQFATQLLGMVMCVPALALIRLLSERKITIRRSNRKGITMTRRTTNGAAPSRSFKQFVFETIWTVGALVAHWPSDSTV